MRSTQAMVQAATEHRTSLDDLGGADKPERRRHHHAAAPVPRDDRRKSRPRTSCARPPGCSRSISCAINIFVMPIAFAGVLHIGSAHQRRSLRPRVAAVDRQRLARLIAFIGGLSAATAMVIVASVALSIMISNDLVIPLFLARLRQIRARRQRATCRASSSTSAARRSSSFCSPASSITAAGANDMPLASIGLLSFAAIAQFAPAFFGGLIWRGANARGAMLGMSPGFWSGPTRCFSRRWPYRIRRSCATGPSASRAQAAGAFRPASLNRLNHGVFWSLAINARSMCFGSLSRRATPIERIQATIFVPRDVGADAQLRRFRTAVTVDELKDTISRYLGAERTERSFQTFETREARRLLDGACRPTCRIIRFAEQLLASAVGSSSARLILSLLFQRNDSSARKTPAAARRRVRRAAAQSRPAADRPRPDGTGHHRLRQRTCG